MHTFIRNIIHYNTPLFSPSHVICEINHPLIAIFYQKSLHEQRLSKTCSEEKPALSEPFTALLPTSPTTGLRTGSTLDHSHPWSIYHQKSTMVSTVFFARCELQWVMGSKGGNEGVMKPHFLIFRSLAKYAKQLLVDHYRWPRKGLAFPDVKNCRKTK